MVVAILVAEPFRAEAVAQSGDDHRILLDLAAGSAVFSCVVSVAVGAVEVFLGALSGAGGLLSHPAPVPAMPFSSDGLLRFQDRAAGGALAVDRDLFSEFITEKIKSNPNINVISDVFPLLLAPANTVIPLSNDISAFSNCR